MADSPPAVVCNGQTMTMDMVAITLDFVLFNYPDVWKVAYRAYGQ